MYFEISFQGKTKIKTRKKGEKKTGIKKNPKQQQQQKTNKERTESDIELSYIIKNNGIMLSKNWNFPVILNKISSTKVLRRLSPACFIKSNYIPVKI